MRTDTIFYQLFQTFPSLLFELINASPTETQDYEFTSREIKELAFRFDGVFLPPAEATNKPIYFAEVQFQPKSDFYWRLFTEIFVYLGQYKPANDWYAVAIFATRSIDPGVPMQYRGLLMSQQVKFIYLDELAATATNSLGLGMVQLVIGNQETAVEITRQLIQQARQQLEDEATRRKVLDLIETILVYKFTNLTREEIEAMFSLSDLKQTRVYQEAKEEGKVEGKIEGKVEGKIEGKVEGKLETVPLLLELGLSTEQIAERLNLDIEEIRKAAQSASNDTQN